MSDESSVRLPVVPLRLDVVSPRGIDLEIEFAMGKSLFPAVSPRFANHFPALGRGKLDLDPVNSLPAVRSMRTNANCPTAIKAKTQFPLPSNHQPSIQGESHALGNQCQ
jgi:hypothetical protein